MTFFLKFEKNNWNCNWVDDCPFSINLKNNESLTGRKVSKFFLFSFEVWHAIRFPFLENLLWATQPHCHSSISANSFGGNYFFFEFGNFRIFEYLPQISIFYLINQFFAVETIQGRKLLKGGHYMQKYVSSIMFKNREIQSLFWFLRRWNCKHRRIVFGQNWTKMRTNDYLWMEDQDDTIYLLSFLCIDCLDKALGQG